MNTKMAALALALLLLSAWPVNGQSAERVAIADDDSGDVEVTFQGQAIPANGRFQNLDIISVHAEESPDYFTFHVGLASAEDVTILETGGVDLMFMHQDQKYRLRYDPVGLIGLSEFSFRNALLERYDPAGESYSHVAFVPSSIDGDVMAAMVPRDLLIDANGSPPFPGRTLSQFQAHSSGFMAGIVYIDGSGEPLVSGIQATDRAPEEPSEVELEVLYGIEQTGHVRLSSMEPMRASNGQASTYLFEIQADSMDGDDDVILDFREVPAGWTVAASRGVVQVSQSEGTTVLIRADVPFAHQHGGTATFVVEGTSLRDGSAVGRVELGVHYLAIPQPSGHHNTLYVHSYELDHTFAALDEALYGRGESIGYPFMNAVEEYDGDDRVPMLTDSRCFICFSEGDLTFTWTVHLSPSLRLGIDMNLSEAGLFEFEFTTPKPLPGAIASGELLYLEPGVNPSFGFEPEGIPVASLETVSLGDLAAMSTTGYAGTVTPLPAGDYIEYERGGGLALVLTLTSSLPAVKYSLDNPTLETGGWFSAPFDEYADAVADLSGFVVPVPEASELDAFESKPEATKKTPGSALLLPLALAPFIRRRR